MAQQNPSLLSRFFRKLGGSEAPLAHSHKAPTGATIAVVDSVSPTAAESSPAAEPLSYVIASSIDDIIRVEEVSDAEFFIGDLFRRRFHGDPPNYPRPFVAFYRPVRSRLEAVGFVHYLAYQDSYLCGGLVIDERRYRQMPSDHRKVIKAAGGIAEKMLRVTFARLSDAPAIWGHVGDALAEKVVLRAGFRHTAHQHVLVCWNKELSTEEKESRLARVVALGPF